MKMKKLLLIVSLLLPCSSFAAISVIDDAHTSKASAVQWTVGYSVSAGSNRCLIAIVNATGSNANPDSVVANGTGMSLIYDGTGTVLGGNTYWYLADPSAGNLVVNWSSNRTGNVHILTVKDCKQSSPLDDSDVSSSASATFREVTITTTVSSLLISSASIEQTTSAHAVAGGQTLVAATQESGNDWLMSSYEVKAGTGDDTHHFEWTTSGSVDMFMIDIKEEIGAESGGLLNDSIIPEQDYYDLLSISFIIILYLLSVCGIIKLICR